jgi:hypothetical protein
MSGAGLTSELEDLAERANLRTKAQIGERFRKSFQTGNNRLGAARFLHTGRRVNKIFAASTIASCPVVFFTQQISCT